MRLEFPNTEQSSKRGSFTSHISWHRCLVLVHITRRCCFPQSGMLKYPPVFLLAAAVECLSFAVWNDACAEFDTRRPCAHLLQKWKWNVCLRSLKVESVRIPTRQFWQPNRPKITMLQYLTRNQLSYKLDLYSSGPTCMICGIISSLDANAVYTLKSEVINLKPPRHKD